MKSNPLVLALLISLAATIGCKSTSGITTNNVVASPGIGSVWTYRFTETTLGATPDHGTNLLAEKGLTINGESDVCKILTKGSPSDTSVKYVKFLANGDIREYDEEMQQWLTYPFITEVPFHASGTTKEGKPKVIDTYSIGKSIDTVLGKSRRVHTVRVTQNTDNFIKDISFCPEVGYYSQFRLESTLSNREFYFILESYTLK